MSASKECYNSGDESTVPHNQKYGFLKASFTYFFREAADTNTPRKTHMTMEKQPVEDVSPSKIMVIFQPAMSVLGHISVQDWKINRKVVFQPSIFRGHVSFREGNMALIAEC